MFTIKDRVALIVGATDDVGQAISIDLAGKGARVAMVDSDSDKLELLVNKVKSSGNEAEKIAIDTTNPSEVKTAIDQIVKKYGTLDILINNIDSDQGFPISDSSFENWENSLKENLNPVVLFSLNVIPGMREKKYGRIINIGSSSYLGFPNKSNYCTSKSALFGLTRSFALELAKDGITVNQVLKGDIKGTASGISEEDEAKAAKGHPVQRLGTPEDVAYAVSYFASDPSKYVTGQTLFVCGGKSLYSSMSV